MSKYPLPLKPESLKDEEGLVVYVNQGASCDVDGRPRYRGANITKAAILSLSYTLYDTLTKVVINSRSDIDALDDNDCTVAVDGSFIIRLGPLDNPILSILLPIGQIESHTIRVVFTWNDGIAV